MEIERKWLIDKNNIPYDLSKYEFLEIEQAYLCFKPTIRIRRIINKDRYIFTMKSSSKDNGLSREEYEIEISKTMYDELLSKKKGLMLSKTRYKVPYDSYMMEIDLFHNEYESFAYMEIEFKTVEEANAYVAPCWVIKELTGDKKYTNASLAKGLLVP